MLGIRSVHSHKLQLMFLLCLLLSLYCITPIQAQNPPSAEEIAAREMVFDAEDPRERIELAEDFLRKYPGSRFVSGILRSALTSACEIDPNSSQTATYAELYFEIERQNASECQANWGVAFTLFQYGSRPAIAATYAERSLAAMSDSEPLQPITKASLFQILSHFRSANSDWEAAISFQREAVRLLVEDAASRPTSIRYVIDKIVEYRGELGFYLLRGEAREEAAPHIGWAVLNDPTDLEVVQALDILADRETEGQAGALEYKGNLLAAIADTMIENNPTQDTRLMLAKSFVTLGVLEERALKHVNEIVLENGPNTGIRQYFDAQVALAQVQAAMEDYEAALETLAGVEQLSTPYDSDYTLTKGQCLEELHRTEEAISAYLEVISLRDDPLIMERIRPLWERTYGTSRNMEVLAEELAQALESWHPEGQAATPTGWQGRVVLAELHTGTDCTPCIAADIAYDHLIEYYPDELLAVLVYHHHIPMPDPMTNPDTEARYSYYEPEADIPSSRVNGTSYYSGGLAHRGAGKKLFNVYRWSIDRELIREPQAAIDLNGIRSGSEISFEVHVHSIDPTFMGTENLRLRLVLAEKEVHYVGLNKLDTHRMVVRDFIGGPEGYPIDPMNSTTKISGIYDIRSLENYLRDYLSEYEENPTLLGDPWPGLKNFWLGFPDEAGGVDEERLVLVAFVQDDETKEVLQAQVLEFH